MLIPPLPHRLSPSPAEPAQPRAPGGGQLPGQQQQQPAVRRPRGALGGRGGPRLPRHGLVPPAEHSGETRAGASPPGGPGPGEGVDCAGAGLAALSPSYRDCTEGSLSLFFPCSFFFTHLLIKVSALRRGWWQWLYLSAGTLTRSGAPGAVCYRLALAWD